MKILLIFCLALIGSMISAQSVIIKGTGAGAVRRTTTITTNVSSVATNLSVTGTLDPDVTGVYAQVSDGAGEVNVRRWYNSGVAFYIQAPGADGWLSPSPDDVNIEPAWTHSGPGYPTNLWAVWDGATGIPTVVYSYQTNYLSVVTVHGTATP